LSAARLPPVLPMRRSPLRGQVLLDLARGDFSDPLTRQQGKLLLRRLINHYLGGQELQSRRVLMELQDL
jgi:DNA repair protein RecO (recombination protein O)